MYHPTLSSRVTKKRKRGRTAAESAGAKKIARQRESRERDVLVQDEREGLGALTAEHGVRDLLLAMAPAHHTGETVSLI